MQSVDEAQCPAQAAIIAAESSVAGKLDYPLQGPLAYPCERSSAMCAANCRATRKTHLYSYFCQVIFWLMQHTSCTHTNLNHRGAHWA